MSAWNVAKKGTKNYKKLAPEDETKIK